MMMMTSAIFTTLLLMLFALFFLACDGGESKNSVELTHFCSCLASPKPLNSCLTMQAFTRDHDVLHLIEQDYMYTLPISYLNVLSEPSPYLYLFTQHDYTPVKPIRWYDIEHLKQFRKLDNRQVTWNLVYYADYHRCDIKLQNGQTIETQLIEQLDLVPASGSTTKFTRKFLLNKSTKANFGATTQEWEISSIHNGFDCKQGYMVVKALHGLVFFDTQGLVTEALYDNDTRTLLANPKDPTQAIFAPLNDVIQKKKRPWMSWKPLLSKPPFGVHSKGITVMLDFDAEMAYFFATIPLLREYSRSNEPFSLRRMSLREFFRCTPAPTTTPPSKFFISFAGLLALLILLTAFIGALLVLIILLRSKRLHGAKVSGSRSRRYHYLTPAEAALAPGEVVRSRVRSARKSNVAGTGGTKPQSLRKARSPKSKSGGGGKEPKTADETTTTGRATSEASSKGSGSTSAGAKVNKVQSTSEQSKVFGATPQVKSKDGGVAGGQQAKA